MRHAIKDHEIQEVADSEPDYELPSPTAFFGSHVNSIPLQSAVQGPRLFYGARFYNQAMPVVNPEAPLVQNLDDTDPKGRSFDEIMGDQAGALRSRAGGEVVAVEPHRIVVKDAEGRVHEHELYEHLPFNRKSVTGDAVVVTRRAGKVWRGPIGVYKWERGDEVRSIDPLTFEAAWQEVTGYLRHRNDKKLLRVKYLSGRSVTVTEDHSLITLGENGKLAPVLPEACVPGKTRSPVVMLPDTEDESLNKSEMYQWGVLAGLYLAAGHIPASQPNLVDIAVTPATRILDIKKLLWSLIPEVSLQNSVKDVIFSSFPIAEWLVALFGKGANHKRISSRVFHYPAKFRLGLINGYMADDGCLWHDTNGAVQVTGVSTSLALRDGLVEVLASLGVFCTLFDVPVNHIKAEWHDAWGFRIMSGHLHKLPTVFFYTERQRKLERLKRAKYRASPFEGLPFPGGLKEAAYKGKSKTEKVGLFKAACRGYVSKWRVMDNDGVLGTMARAETMWDVVESVETAPYEEWVFDLEVANSQMFAVSCGLIVHNSSINHSSQVKAGDKVEPGQLLASSNFTDKHGTLAMGRNARVALIPYKGFSMDDAMVISEGFAKTLVSEHTYAHSQDFDADTRGGLSHYKSLFPDTFVKKQLDNMSEDGVAKPGTVLQPGDPYILATRPKTVSSSSQALGRLSKTMRMARRDASQVWDGNEPATVLDVADTKTGKKVVLQTLSPTKNGDKAVFRSGQKGIISKILPDEHMPRTLDGQPMDVLLNPLGIPSRANASLIYELLLGKVADKQGAPIKIPGFTKPGEKWYDLVRSSLKGAGLAETEELWDPMTGKKMEQPVTVGNGFILKLHHIGDDKLSHRSQGSYDCYSADSEVLTARGWVPWPEAKEDDEFFTVIDDQAVYRKASRVVSYDFEGELLGFQSKYLDWLVTPNHQHLLKQKKIWKRMTAEQISTSNKFHVKQFGFGKVAGSSPAAVTIPAPDFTRERTRKCPEGKHAASSIALPDYAEFVGWWVSEGSVVFDEEVSRYRVYIWQNDIANPAESQQIRDLLDRLPYTWSRHHRTDGVLAGYFISDAGLAQHLIEKYGRICGDKRLWREIFSWSPEHRALLLKAACLGDGSECRHANSNTRVKPNIIESYATTSEALANDIQELSVGLGFGALINEYPSFVDSQGYTCSRYFIVGFHKTRTTATACTYERYDGVHTRVPYKGKVYCATIPESGLLYVRRNKKPVLSGNSNEQPAKGSGEAAQSKRLSGLEVHALMSAGAYATLREGATLRGARNDEYWRNLRAGRAARPNDKLFVWDKFRALLAGAGLHTQEHGDGKLRLGPMTDRHLEEHKPVEVRHGGMIDLNTMEPHAGGLFDPAMVANSKWGKATLPVPLPNPAFEPAVAKLLGLKQNDIREIIAGRMELPEHLR